MSMPKNFPLAVLFSLTFVSSSGYYTCLKRYATPRVDRDEEFYRLILDVFNDSNGI